LLTARESVNLTAMKRIAIFFAGLLTTVFCLAGSVETTPYGLPDGLYTEITTERGVVVCELFYKQTPMTVANYVGLAEGKLGNWPRRFFYNGLKWHRVVPGFVVQGGDPSGTGDGGPGYQFPDEFVPGLRHDSVGVLQMANDGPDSNGSQYCLMLSPQNRLNYLHTVFGRVVRGSDVLPKIEQGDTMHVKILRIGSSAKAFRADEDAFKELESKAKRYSGPKQPGPDAPFDDPDKILPTEWGRARAFNYKLVNFERFTGQKIAARVFAKRPDAAAGDQLEEYLRSEAVRLGVNKRGALAMYFADLDEWQLRFGEETTAQFAGRTSVAEILVSGKSPERFRSELLALAKTKASAAIAQAEKSSDKPVPAGQKIKLKVDAVLDQLIFALEPAGS
jgi:cyclophilin family peptidyl-prolyl cis-trans isomerase